MTGKPFAGDSVGPRSRIDEAHNNALQILVGNTIYGYNVGDNNHGLSHLRRNLLDSLDACDRAFEEMEERKEDPDADTDPSDDE